LLQCRIENERTEGVMALKDLLVYVNQTEGAYLRLRLAADLASRHGSRLTALFAWEWTPIQLEERSKAEMGLVSGEELDRLVLQTEGTISGRAERLRATLDQLGRERGLTTEWRSVPGPAALVVPQHARYADLCILGRDGADDESSEDYTFSEELLFVTGRPVLFIPPVSVGETVGRHIAVAWNASRPAARAVNDAMPLIEGAERTTVLTINPQAYMEHRGALPADHMVEHLSQHGARADLIRLEHVPTSAIANTLQAKAREIGADLLVAGAFGHAKLWEKLLGGVTRNLLDHMNFPIFMSH
jgi:nucleotide-binding universal stress UspA family protein